MEALSASKMILMRIKLGTYDSACQHHWFVVMSVTEHHLPMFPPYKELSFTMLIPR
jgi:hypothetical protein